MKIIRRLFQTCSSHLPLGPEEKERLFRYTPDRWLYNEKEQCASRYVKFDVEGAQEMACKALNATRCTRFTKLAEGSYNKVFVLNFDNGAEAILRIPCPIAGPAHWMTASEVATMEFARDELGIPTPKVLSWSSRASSPNNYLGTEYILMERVQAVDALTRWGLIQKSEALPLIKGLYSIDQKLAQVRFGSIGSLYFKEDLETFPNSRPLFAPGSKLEGRFKGAVERYQIGPLADRHWWRGDRIGMHLDCGPWTNMADFLMASAKNERTWIQSSHLRDSIQQQALQPKDPERHYRILEMYEAVIPYITPDVPLSEPTLWHPNISLSNIQVSKEGPATISALIDWQGAFTGPLCTQAVFPPAFQYRGDLIEVPSDWPFPDLPLDFDDRPTEEVRLRLAIRQFYYMCLMGKDPLRVAASELPHLQSLGMLPYWAVRCWSDGWTRMIDHLLQIKDMWNDIASDGRPCPIDVSPDEEKEFRMLIERSNRYDASIESLTTLLNSGGDGWVPHDRYEVRRNMWEKARMTWDERKMGGPFPYEDGKYSFFLS